jgi:tetratricopeptide (TPR) repeat protein
MRSATAGPGYYTEAVTIHDRDLRAAELAGDPRGQAHVLIRLGHIYRRQSRYQHALCCFERALDLAPRPETRSPNIRCSSDWP